MKPELLSPAGDLTCLKAAIENGADAVYFGLRRHNARIRAMNFDGGELSEVMGILHRQGVRGYVTLNTLVFPHELNDLEASLREIVEAGADAVIIQDLGLARLIRALTPDLEIHASTQMSITSEEGVRLAAELGCSRIILARELSLDEIRKLKSQTEVPLEVFVHGALCVAYSGQCLTSEALGGRSANRGECAQACRMPYEIVCDGRTVDLDRTQYLLSPQDLAAYDLIPELIEIGIASLKIEGRLKSPEYVANITRHYRDAIDAAFAGRPVEFSAREIEEMQLSFSRGFSHGFLDGNDHKRLVRGDYAKKRGVLLGKVLSVSTRGVAVLGSTTVKAGDGVVFDGDERKGIPEQGGRVYEACPGKDSEVFLRFGRADIDLRRLHPGQTIWKTDDPELTSRLRKSFQGGPGRFIELDLEVQAEAGSPLRITARSSNGIQSSVQSASPLAPARSVPVDQELLKEQLGRLGGTCFRLRELQLMVAGSPMVPRSLLNQLRRELVERLESAAQAAPKRRLTEHPVVPALLAPIAEERDRQFSQIGANESDFELFVLCRQHIQIEAALAEGISTIYADYQDIKEYSRAVAEVHRAGGRIYLATPRIEKPHEANLFRYLAKLGADGFLARNAGGLSFCAERSIPFVVDFSMNAANALSVQLLKSLGAERVTASYDLNGSQLLSLIDTVPPGWLEVVIHQHIPMFHMEHCVFCAFLSPGTDHTNCGRPCDRHHVKLRDRVGVEHPLTADVGCRNTLFNAIPQTAAEYLPRLRSRGVSQFRVEFLEDDGPGVARTLGLYRAALAGQRDCGTLWRSLKASSQYGVTRGSLNVL